MENETCMLIRRSLGNTIFRGKAREKLPSTII